MPTQPCAQPHAADSRSIRLGALAIIAAILAAYANAPSVPLLFDDVLNIGVNPAIRSIFPLSETLRPPPHTGLTNRPVSQLSYAVNYALGGMDPFGYHLVNLGAHILAALALFGLLRRILLLPALGLKERFGAQATPLALTAALAWGLHPLLTHGVTYLSGRSTVFVGLFSLLTLYGAVRGWAAGRFWPWHAVALAAFFIGAGTKETIVAVPLLVLFVDWFLFSGSLKTLFKRSPGLHGTLWVALTLMSVVFLLFFHFSPWFLRAETLLHYPLTQPKIELLYLKLILWPINLSIEYGWPLATWASDWPYIGAWLLLAGAVTWGSIQRRFWALPLAWFFLALLPLHSFLPLVPHFPLEYRAYLAACGPVTLAVLAGFTLFTRWPPLARVPLRPLALGLLGALGLATFMRNAYYQSDLLIWEDTVRKQPHSITARLQAGTAWYNRSRFEEALAHFQVIRALDPLNYDGHLNAGAMLANLERFNEALPILETALRLRPGEANPRANLGACLIGLGRLEEARALLEEAVGMAPRHGNAQYHLAHAYFELGRLAEARRHLEIALRRNPDNQLYQDLDKRLRERERGTERTGDNPERGDPDADSGSVGERAGDDPRQGGPAAGLGSMEETNAPP